MREKAVSFNKKLAELCAYAREMTRALPTAALAGGHVFAQQAGGAANTVQSGDRPAQGGARPSVSGPGASEPAASTPKVSVLGSIGLGMLVAFIFAAGIFAVDGVIAFYEGSFIAWGLFGIVLAFWACAAALAALALGIVLTPLLFAAKGSLRRCLPAVPVIAAGFWLNALIIRPIVAESDPLGGSLFLNTYFLAVWGIVLGIAAAWAAVRARGAHIQADLVLVAGMLAAAGLAPYAPDYARAYALVIAPVVFLGLGAVWLQKAQSKFGRILPVPAAFLIAAALVFGVARNSGERPLEAVRNGPAPGAPAEAPAGSPNVIIIVLDTLRASHTSVCGYEFETTPNLERLVAESHFYPNGVSTAPSTLPAHASLFTGLQSREHGAHGGVEGATFTLERAMTAVCGLDGSHETLAERLLKEGYNTAGISANYSRLCRQLGFSRGFRYYYDMPRLLVFTPGVSDVYKYAIEATDTLLGLNGKLCQPFWSARQINGFAESWLENNAAKPFFLFLNYMDIHCPYAAPRPFDKIDGPDLPYDPILRIEPWQKFYHEFMRTGEGLTPELRARAINQYDGGVAYTDHHIGKLIETLKREGIYDNTLLIVTSDHGEFFGEHGLLVHRMDLYEGVSRIPIIVKFPGGLHAGEVDDRNVSLLDVYATVLDCLGLAVPEGVTSQPLHRVTHPIIAESYVRGPYEERNGIPGNRRLAALYDGKYKLIWSDKGRRELYDLSVDTEEKVDLAGRMPEVVARLEGIIEDWRAGAPEYVGRIDSQQGRRRRMRAVNEALLTD